MINGKKVLAVIPARGGSKGLPKKNIMSLSGKPLIAWTIIAAKKSKYIDCVILSSENDDIIKIGKKYGANIPFKRPYNLATDIASSIDVVIHTILTIKNKFDIVILLQPTSPLRTEIHIDEALETMTKINSNSIISVTKEDHPIEWTSTLGVDMKMANFIFNINKDRRQDYLDYYTINGAIYAANIKFFLKIKSFLSENTIAYIMNKLDSIDIDTKSDLTLCELLLERKKNELL